MLDEQLGDDALSRVRNLTSSAKFASLGGVSNPASEA
jgi:hypothetical protein